MKTDPLSSVGRRPTTVMPGTRGTPARFLFWLLAARLLLHAFYVPVFEGPDEPFHLGRAALFADGSLREALAGERLPETIVSAIRGHPCGPALSAAFGCPRFRGFGAFDMLQASPKRESPGLVVNYEAHQPPLFYAAVAPLLAPIASPESRILAMRLVSVFLVLAALAFPMRRLASGLPESASTAFVLFLLLPGAAESLARASNDAAVFFWTALIVDRIESRSRPSVLVALLAVGPLLKLTAFPVVAVVVSALWLGRRRRLAAVGALVSLSVFGVQWLRGWSWGGTYELNRITGTTQAGVPFAAGFARSLYTFVKTVFWLGEWSAFRAPRMVVVFWFALLIVLGVRQVERLRRAHDVPSGIPTIAHVSGALVAGGGFAVMAVLNAKLFGQWGGLGGWYLWPWTPWLAVAMGSAVAGGRRWLVALGAFALVANVLWASSAADLYGP